MGDALLLVAFVAAKIAFWGWYGPLVRRSARDATLWFMVRRKRHG